MYSPRENEGYSLKEKEEKSVSFLVTTSVAHLSLPFLPVRAAYTHFASSYFRVFWRPLCFGGHFFLLHAEPFRTHVLHQAFVGSLAVSGGQNAAIQGLKCLMSSSQESAQLAAPSESHKGPT